MTENRDGWRRWWRRVGYTLAFIGLAGFTWAASIWYQYQAVLPRYPDKTIGRVYPLNVHGVVVYQTRDERNWLNEVQYSSIGIFALSALMSVIYGKKPER